MDPNNKNVSKKSLPDSLGKTLISSDLTSIPAEILEVVLDANMLEDGILRDIPIIGSLIAMGKTARTVQDYLFTKKMLAFLHGISSVTIEQRAQEIAKVDDNAKYNQKVGSKLLYIIDRTQDHTTAGFVAKLFVAFIQQELTYQEFCKASMIINKIDYFDLMDFLSYSKDEFGKNGTEDMGIEEHDSFFINAGLCVSHVEEVNVREREITDWKDAEMGKFEVTGGETKLYLTLIGKKIHNILQKSQ